MSRPWPRPPQPRGAFDLVPRSQSAASPLCSSPRPSSSSGGSQGYTLGGAASAEASREQQERQNDCSIAQFKEKERQKKLKKLEETIARYSHLNTAPGHSLDVDDSHGSLPRVREKQCQAYNETVESFKKKQLEHEPKEAQRQAEKLKEKVKKYAYLNTAPGRRLCPDASIHSVEKKLEHDAQETLVLQQSTETLEPLDNDKAMREMRRRLQENYNSSLKHKGQANIEI